MSTIIPDIINENEVIFLFVVFVIISLSIHSNSACIPRVGTLAIGQSVDTGDFAVGEFVVHRYSCWNFEAGDIFRRNFLDTHHD